MGEMADYYAGLAMEQQAEFNGMISDELKKTNEQLVTETQASKHSLIVGIREYYEKNKQLSKKQRYCLAKWIIEHDDEDYDGENEQKMQVEKYHSDDYAGLVSGALKFYYGYEVEEDDEWCFVVKNHGDEVFRAKRSVIELSVKNDDQLDSVNDYLIAGIGMWLLLK